jgi:hypothetical protein
VHEQSPIAAPAAKPDRGTALNGFPKIPASCPVRFF